MEIVIPIRQVPDVALDIRINEGTIIEDDSISYVISSWDETAIEAGLQIVEDVGGKVTLLGIGPERVSNALRKGLAMGAHQAIHLKYFSNRTDSFCYAKILQKIIERNSFDIVLMGKQSQDTDAGLTGSMLAEFLDLPQVTNIIRYNDITSTSIKVSRKGDNGTENIGLKLPALITVNDSLNEPRLASMRGIMMAKKKYIELLTLEDIGLDEGSTGINGSMTEVLYFEKPDSRKAGKYFEGEETQTVPKAMNELINKAKLAF